MTPTQREAALRLVRQPISQGDPAWHNEAAALLRELAEEPVQAPDLVRDFPAVKAAKKAAEAELGYYREMMAAEPVHTTITWDAQGRRLVNGELAPEHRAGEPAQEATPDDMRVYDAIAANYAAEPVAYVDPRQLARGCASLHCITKPEYRSHADAQAGLEYTPVYLHPPQQRKPLSIEKIVAIANSCLAASDDDCTQNQTTIFARAIEKAVLENITGEPT